MRHSKSGKYKVSKNKHW